MKLVFRLCAMLIYFAVIYIAVGLSFRNFLSVKDLVLLGIGACIFEFAYYLDKRKNSKIYENLYKSVFWSGLFVSMISILSYVMNNEISIRIEKNIIIDILVNLRCFLYALGFDILLYRNTQSQSNFIDKKNSYEKLTHREYEICLLIIKGLSNKDIGEKLFISSFTVKKHVYNIFSKLNISQRSEIKYYFDRNSKTN